MNTRKWNQPLDAEHAGINEDLETLKAINAALQGYNDALKNNQPTQKHLQNIVDACAVYIESIPIKSRVRDSATKAWTEILPEWPQVMAVLELQKKAVAIISFPEGEKLAQARWNLVRGLYEGGGKALDTAYWGEYRFGGNTVIASWILERGYAEKFSLRSIKEALKADQAKIGIGKEEVKYLEDPRALQLLIDNSKVYQNNRLFDTKNSRGTHMDYGECIFVARRDGKIYANDPDIPVNTSIHHSSFISGKSVMCAGTLRAQDGKITEVTVLSGHYKPRRKELLQFLAFLKTNNIDLSQIKVIDQVGGLHKNALTYLRTNGRCLPDDRAEFMFKIGLEKFKNDDSRGCEEYMEKAIALGSHKALYNKAVILLETPEMYPEMKDARKETALKILNDLADKSPSYQSQALNKLFDITQDKNYLYRSRYRTSPVLPGPPSATYATQLTNLSFNIGELVYKGATEDQKNQFKYTNVKEMIDSVSGIKKLHELNQALKAASYLPNSQSNTFMQPNMSEVTQKIIFLMQQKVLQLAKIEKIGITFEEEKNLRSILDYPSGKNDPRLLTKSCKEQFIELANKGEIKLLSREIPAPDAKKNMAK